MNNKIDNQVIHELMMKRMAYISFIPVYAVLLVGLLLVFLESSLEGWLSFIVITAYSFAVIFTAMVLSQRATSVKLCLFYFDMAWMMFLGPFILLVVAAMGGVSQAVKDNVAGPAFDRYILYAGITLLALVISQILVIPLLRICYAVVQKITVKPSLPGAGQGIGQG